MSFSTTTPSQISQRRKTALATIQAYEDWTTTSVMSFRSPTCIHQVLPKSLNRPAMDNETYAAYFSAILPHFRDFKIRVTDMIEDEQANKIAVWASSTAVTDIGSYSNEYMLMLHFNDAGDKVDRFFEFVDSAISENFFPALRKHIAEKESSAK